MKHEKQPRFAICIRNENAEDLEVRKVYQVVPDESAATAGYLRIIDESGEDYLYPKDYFILLELSEEIERTLLAAA